MKKNVILSFGLGLIILIVLGLSIFIIKSNKIRIINYDNTGILTCTTSNTDENGYSSYLMNIVGYTNGKLVTFTEIIIQEVDEYNYDYLFSIYKDFSKYFKNINGVKTTAYKNDARSVMLIQKTDLTELDYEKFNESWEELFESWEESNLSDNDRNEISITKDTTIKDYKDKMMANGLICK